MIKTDKADVEQTRETLRAMLRPGDTVYTILRHVSQSGMRRRISLVVIRGGEPSWIDSSALCVLEGKRFQAKDKEGITVDGCGMDMGFDLVYRLGSALYPDGFAVEGIGRNGDTSGHDNDGGYALKQRWL